MEIILGMDVSTHCVGMTIVSVENDKVEILEITHLRLKVNKKIKGIESLLIKSKLLKEKLETFKNYHISKVIIEEPQFNPNKELNHFMLKFNGIVSQDIYDTLGIIPEFITSNDARKFAFPELMSIRKFNKKGDVYNVTQIEKFIQNNELVLFGGYHYDISKKFILFNLLNDKFPNINWVYDKNGELSNENFDASDSLICILGHINYQKYKDIEPIIKKYKIDKINDVDTIEYSFEFCDKIFDKKIVLE